MLKDLSTFKIMLVTVYKRPVNSKINPHLILRSFNSVKLVLRWQRYLILICGTAWHVYLTKH